MNGLDRLRRIGPFAHGKGKVVESLFGDLDPEPDQRKTGNQWGAFTPIAELNNPSYNEGSQTISADGRYMCCRTSG